MGRWRTKERLERLEGTVYGFVLNNDQVIMDEDMSLVRRVMALEAASRAGCCVNGCGCGMPQHADLKQQMEDGPDD